MAGGCLLLAASQPSARSGACANPTAAPQGQVSDIGSIIVWALSNSFLSVKPSEMLLGSPRAAAGSRRVARANGAGFGGVANPEAGRQSQVCDIIFSEFTRT